MAASHLHNAAILPESVCDTQTAVGRLLTLDYQESLLVVRTSDYKLHRSRIAARIGGLLLMIGVTYLLTLSTLAAFLIPIGLLLLFWPHVFIRPATYAAIDLATQRLLRPSTKRASSLNIADIQCVRGVYEVQGWDSRSAFYALLLDGSEELITTFTGTDDPLAESLCLTLGKILHRPASYTGLFDQVLFRYEPAAEQSPDHE